MTWKPLILVAAACLLLMGCPKHMTTVSPEETMRVYDAPFEEVAKKLVTAVYIHDFRIIDIDTDDNVIRTDFVEFDVDSELGKAVLQATSSAEVIEKGRFRMDIYVTEIEESKTKVQVMTQVEKFSRVANLTWKAQPSNGYIEKRVLDRLEEIVEGTW
jgi:hypothetical protein